jgi:quinol monooxygenase YgiN
VDISRRKALHAAAVAALVGDVTGQQKSPMYGLIGKITAVTGKRGALATILLESTVAMPGCLSYVIANDPKEPDTLWVTEVWESEADHKASLALPAVKDAIAKGRPLIASFGECHETVPVGVHGIRVR